MERYSTMKTRKAARLRRFQPSNGRDVPSYKMWRIEDQNRHPRAEYDEGRGPCNRSGKQSTRPACAETYAATCAWPIAAGA